MEYELDVKIGDTLYDEFAFPGIEIKVTDIDGYFIVVDILGEQKFYCWTVNAKTGLIDFPENLSKTPYTITGRTPCYKVKSN